MKCPYKEECGTVLYHAKEKAGFIRGICNTNKHKECLHYWGSLKPQHDERQRLYGDPHAFEPDWDKIKGNGGLRENEI